MVFLSAVRYVQALLSPKIIRFMRQVTSLIGFLMYSQCRSSSYYIRIGGCPGWCGSVYWALVCQPRGHWFDICSGHMPVLWARSPVGSMREATNWCSSRTSLCPSLSPSLLLSLKILNTIFFLKRKARGNVSCHCRIVCIFRSPKYISRDYRFQCGTSFNS